MIVNDPSPDLGQLLAWRSRLLDARYNGVRRVNDSSGESILYDTPESMDRALANIDSMIRRLSRGPAANPQYITCMKGA